MTRMLAGFVCAFATLAPAQIPIPGFPVCTPLTMQRRWQAPVLLYGGMTPELPSYIGAIDTAAGNNGEAVVVWLARDPLGRNFLYARRYLPPVFPQVSGTWTSARTLDISIGGLAHPSIAIDDQGNALAVWERPVNGGGEIRASFYNRVLDQWQTTTISSPNAAVRGMPHVAINPAGDGMAVWQEVAFSGMQVFASRFERSRSAWTGSLQISNINFADGATTPKVAMDGAGRATAVWQQSSVIGSGPSRVFAARFTPGGTWSGAVVVSSNSARLDPKGRYESAWDPALSLNAAGNGWVGWVQGYDSQFVRVRVRRLSPAPIDTSGITNPDVIVHESDPYSASNLRLSTADDGSLGIAFIAKDSSGTARSVFARQLNASKVLVPALPSPPTALETRAEVADELNLAMDAAGNGIAAWIQSDGVAPTLFANHLTHAPTTLRCPERWVWSGAIPAESTTETVRRVRLAVHRSTGTALAVWMAGAGTTPDKVFVSLFR